MDVAFLNQAIQVRRDCRVRAGAAEPPAARSASSMARPVADGWSHSTARISNSIFDGAANGLINGGIRIGLSQ